MSQLQTGTIAAFFNDQTSAHQAIEALQQAGFNRNQIGVAYSSGAQAGGTGDTGNYRQDVQTSSTAGSTTHKAGEKASGMWEKVKNFFEGGDVEPYADERDRGQAQSHEITGAGGYGSEYGSDYGSGDVHHALSGMSFDDQRAMYFDQRVSSSSQGALVTVTAADRATEAEAILEQNGGDLGRNTTGSEYASTGTQRTGASATGTGELTGQQRIQLLGEILRVHKERVNRGEVRVRKEVVTEQQTIQVPVTREELVVERIPVDQQRAATGSIGESSEIRIPLNEEHATAEKQTVVREEVAVGKRASERVEQVGGDVRREELEIDDPTNRRSA